MRILQGMTGERRVVVIRKERGEDFIGYDWREERGEDFIGYDWREERGGD